MKKRIEEAAMRNATCRFYDDDDEILDISVKSFEDGELWRINSVWHDDISECKDVKRWIVVEYNNGHVDVLPDIRYLDGVKDLVVRVAYVDDLLPERKEENNDKR